MANSKVSARALDDVLKTREPTRKESSGRTEQTTEPISICPPTIGIRHFRHSTPGQPDRGLPALKLLYVGRIVPHKKIEDLLALFHEFQRLAPDSCLLLVGPSGDPAYEARLKGILEETFEHMKDKVHRLGEVSDEKLKNLYAGATAFLTMTEHEGILRSCHGSHGISTCPCSRSRSRQLWRRWEAQAEFGRRRTSPPWPQTSIACSATTLGDKPWLPDRGCVSSTSNARQTAATFGEPWKRSCFPMRVLFNTYSVAFDCPGGGEVMLLEYKSALEALGVEVILYDPWHPQFDQADLVHYFSVQGGSMNFCSHVKRRGIPLLISPIIWLTAENVPTFPIEEIRTLLHNCDLILPNSKAEQNQLSEYFGLNRQKFAVVYNGINKGIRENRPARTISLPFRDPWPLYPQCSERGE